MKVRFRAGENPVGVSGLEPPAPSTPCWCASQLRHTPNAEAKVCTFAFF